MQFLPLPVALSISLFVGTSVTMATLAASSHAPAADAARERCIGYVLLLASLADLDATERFVVNLDNCVDALSAG